MAPAGIPRIESVQTDARVFLFTAVVSLLSAILFGLLPAMRAARADVHDALKEGGRGADAGVHGRLLRSGLVVAQVALALVLLVGAGLLLRTFQQLNRVDPGFDPHGVLTMNLNLPSARYGQAEDRIGFYRSLEEQLDALPGVAAASLTNTLPLGGFDSDSTFNIEGRPLPPPGQQVAAWVRRTTPGYFPTMRIDLRAGRDFRESDNRDATRVAIINESLARRFFVGEDPIGQRLTFGDPAAPDATWREIIGVAHDIKNFGIGTDSRLAVYLPYEQGPSGYMFAVVRTDGDPAALAGSVRETVARLDSELAVASLTPMDQVVRDSLATERFITTLMAVFAGVAMLLAVIGLYGVVSYTVGLRLHELGVRVALGARPPDIGRLVLGNSLVLVGIGTAVGFLSALAMTRLMEGLLFGVAATDPLTYSIVVAALVGAGLLAAALPARRAAAVDPVAVLNRQ